MQNARFYSKYRCKSNFVSAMPLPLDGWTTGSKSAKNNNETEYKRHEQVKRHLKHQGSQRD